MSTTTPQNMEGQRITVLCAKAAAAAEELADLRRWPLSRRRAMLEAIADAIDRHAQELVALADGETALGTERLGGEVVRTTSQLRLLGRAAADTGILGVRRDCTSTADLYRAMRPIGPVAVYAASNFPFAFSVAGGDTASALAAGCSVVVKEHPGHPRTSARTAQVVNEALTLFGAPDGTFATVDGLDAGRQLMTDHRIRAAAFTGSLAGGQALAALAASRPDPIPFYGELGSLNPVIVTRAAVAARGGRIASEFVASFTLGAGQFCTKPGLLLVPHGHDLGPYLERALAAVTPRPLLTEAIRSALLNARVELGRRADEITLMAQVPDSGDRPGAALYTVAARDLAADRGLLAERFGPVSILATYDDEDDLLRTTELLPGSLTGSVHAEPSDDDLSRRLIEALAPRCGRLVWNGWPTGVAVSPAMNHGGPWPASTSPRDTSVGTAAIDRFLVPIAYQDVPLRLLPGPLAEAVREGAQA